MFFGKRKQKPSIDLTGKQAVLHCSICNGEQVAGFKDMETGKFEEVMLIRNASDLEEFKRKYGVDEVTKEY